MSTHVTSIKLPEASNVDILHFIAAECERVDIKETLAVPIPPHAPICADIVFNPVTDVAAEYKYDYDIDAGVGTLTRVAVGEEEQASTVWKIDVHFRSSDKRRAWGGVAHVRIVKHVMFVHIAKSGDAEFSWKVRAFSRAGVETVAPARDVHARAISHLCNALLHARKPKLIALLLRDMARKGG